ncbi:MAG: YXWGXW repeat-containing protein, partial [Formivibrio sp.]|nr:YXWGXW repeat-containing protein [Formivibrio sp.]
MTLARYLAKLRYILIIPIALASLASMPSYAHADVIIRQAPPPMRAEMVPRARPVYVWDQGHWRWAGRGYAWVPGHWRPVMHGGR